MGNEIAHERVDHPPYRLVDEAATGEVRVQAPSLLEVPMDNRRRGQFFQTNESRADTVVDVVIVIGDLVREVGNLRFQGRLAADQEPLAERPQCLGRWSGTVLEDALTRLEAEIEAVKGCVTVLEHVYDTKALEVVFKPTMPLHAGVESVLPGVAKGGVTEVVSKADRLDQVFAEAKSAGNRAADLGDLQAVRQARTKKVAFVIYEDLGLVLKSPKRSGMNNSIAVALELTPRIGRVLSVNAPSRALR